MTDQQFLECYREIGNYTDPDAFVSDMALSSMWGDPEDAVEIPAERISELRRVWDALHRSARDIWQASGLSQRKLAEKFCIPYRKMERWCNGVSNPPDHDRIMMQRLLGLL